MENFSKQQLKELDKRFEKLYQRLRKLPAKGATVKIHGGELLNYVTRPRRARKRLS